jgi:hypothetical protein
MFPEETHVKILQRIDAIEAEMFGIYRRLERLRLDLQAKWRVLPSGARWSEERVDKKVNGEGQGA